jgi:hypothetical protein
VAFDLEKPGDFRRLRCQDFALLALSLSGASKFRLGAG